MSTIGDILSGLRRVVLLDDRVGRLETRVGETESMVRAHESRIVRIETLIEFGGRRLPRS
jgi:hypothetical protein